MAKITNKEQETNNSEQELKSLLAEINSLKDEKNSLEKNLKETREALDKTDEAYKKLKQELADIKTEKIIQKENSTTIQKETKIRKGYQFIGPNGLPLVASVVSYPSENSIWKCRSLFSDVMESTFLFSEEEILNFPRYEKIRKIR